MKDLKEKQDKEFERWEIHQVGCAFREKGKWIMLACDMNCKNVFDGVISKIRSETLQAVREESEQTIKDFELFWGLAPVGTPKGDKLKEIQDWLRRHLLKSLDI